jgi:hypothetical protein
MRRVPKPKKGNDYPIVAVTWEDATLLDSGTWAEKPETHEYKPVIFRQVGFLLSDTPSGIILTCTMGDDQMAPRTQIPRGMVRAVTVLVA